MTTRTENATIEFGLTRRVLSADELTLLRDAKIPQGKINRQLFIDALFGLDLDPKSVYFDVRRILGEYAIRHSNPTIEIFYTTKQKY